MTRSPRIAAAGLAVLIGVSSYVLWLRSPETPPEKKGDYIPTPSPPLPAQEACKAIDEGGGARDHYASVVVLLDTSRSFHTAAASSPYMNAVSRFPEMSLSLAKRLPTPQRIVVNTIGTLSLSHTPVCDMYIPQRTLFRRGCTDEQLQDRFVTCKGRLAKLPGEQDTDITGALAYAASVLESQEDVLRGIIMFTDLDEDVSSAGEKEAHPDLTGICVAVFYDFAPQDALDPDRASERVRDWQERLHGFKAKHVLVRHANSLTDNDLTGFLSDCE